VSFLLLLVVVVQKSKYYLYLNREEDLWWQVSILPGNKYGIPCRVPVVKAI
jgi:hypothetical protein